MFTMHQNVLIEGSSTDAEAMLRSVEPHCRRPFADWSPALTGRPATLVVRNASKLTSAEQLQLLEWIRRGTRSQVLSMTEEQLYPLVKRGRFSEDLFYLLNISKIDLFGDDDPDLQLVTVVEPFRTVSGDTLFAQTLHDT